MCSSSHDGDLNNKGFVLNTFNQNISFIKHIKISYYYYPEKQDCMTKLQKNFSVCARERARVNKARMEADSSVTLKEQNNLSLVWRGLRVNSLSVINDRILRWNVSFFLCLQSLRETMFVSSCLCFCGRECLCRPQHPCSGLICLSVSAW